MESLLLYRYTGHVGSVLKVEGFGKTGEHMSLNLVHSAHTDSKAGLLSSRNTRGQMKINTLIFDRLSLMLLQVLMLIVSSVFMTQKRPLNPKPSPCLSSWCLHACSSMDYKTTCSHRRWPRQHTVHGILNALKPEKSYTP